MKIKYNNLANPHLPVSSLAQYNQALAFIQTKKYLQGGICWLEGTEDFFIDELTQVFENEVIPEEHKTLNQYVQFGQDISTTDLLSTASQSPFGYERQLVIVKEAQKLNQLQHLIHYIQKPSPYTLLVIAYKNKTLDKRSKLYKALQQKAQYYTFSKLYPRDLTKWIGLRINHYKLRFTNKAMELLTNHIGNNLSLLDNELKKLALNIKDQLIQEQDIYNHIGINRTYNVFEMQSALSYGNISKAYEIIQYFEQNEKANPPQGILISLYNYFTKLYILYGLGAAASKQEAAAAISVNPYFMDEYIRAKRNYSFDEVCLCIQHISLYYKKSIGIDSSPLDKNTLLSSLFFKITQTKHLLSLT